MVTFHPPYQGCSSKWPHGKIGRHSGFETSSKWQKMRMDSCLHLRQIVQHRRHPAIPPQLASGMRKPLQRVPQVSHTTKSSGEHWLDTTRKSFRRHGTVWDTQWATTDHLSPRRWVQSANPKQKVWNRPRRTHIHQVQAPCRECVAGESVHHMPRCQQPPKRGHRQIKQDFLVQILPFRMDISKIATGLSTIQEAHKRKTVWVTNTLDSNVVIEFS